MESHLGNEVQDWVLGLFTQPYPTDFDPSWDELSIYALPLQIHPLRSAWHYGTPRNFVKDSWKNAGPFLTVGWPQDTTALEDGFIDDEHFIRLCESIVNTRERVLMHHLDSFKEGVLGCVFDTLDRMQHMFWRDRPDLIDEWYVKMDALGGPS